MHLERLGGDLPIPLSKNELTPQWFTAAFKDSGLIPAGANVRVNTCQISYLSGDPSDPSSGGFTGNELLRATLTYGMDPTVHRHKQKRGLYAGFGQDKLRSLVSGLGLPFSVAIKKFDLPLFYNGQPQG
jgi:hypothetical protein